MSAIAYAVVRGEDPQVFLAEDIETLQWVLAIHLVAQTSPSLYPDAPVERLRQALVNREWGEAVLLWMEATRTIVDVYPSHRVYDARDVELGDAELQFSPLFRNWS